MTIILTSLQDCYPLLSASHPVSKCRANHCNLHFTTVTTKAHLELLAQGSTGKRQTQA